MLVGEANRPDNSRVQKGFVFNANDLRFDGQIAEVRPGFVADGAPAGGTKLVNMAPWRKAGTMAGAEFGEGELVHKVVSGYLNEPPSGGVGPNENHGAMWVDREAGAGYESIPIPSSNPLLGKGQMRFAQMSDYLYGVDGSSGLVRYDGTLDLTQALTVLAPTSQPTTLNVTASPYLLEPTGRTLRLGGVAAPELGTVTLTTDTLNLTPFGVLQSRLKIITNGATKARVIMDLGAARNLSQSFAWGTSLLFEAMITKALSVPAHLRIVTSAFVDFAAINADVGTATAFTTLNSYSWQINPKTAGQWEIFELSTAGVPAAILADVRWLILEVDNAADWVGETLYFGALHSPGNQSVGNVWYKVRAAQSSPAATNPSSSPIVGLGAASDVNLTTGASSTPNTTRSAIVNTSLTPQPTANTSTSIGHLLGDRVGTTLGSNSIGAPSRRVKVDLNLSQAGPSGSLLELYRSLSDPALTDPDGAIYRLVASIPYDSTVSPLYTLYDNMAEEDLRNQPTLPPDTLPPLSGRTAPHFILSRRGRLFYFRTDEQPSYIGASDIGNPESLAPVEFSSQKIPGLGGFETIDQLTNEGGITGATMREDEILIFTRRGTWSWRILNEGLEGEEWIIQRVNGIGCAAPNSICYADRGIVWANETGIQYLSDGSIIPLDYPLSDSINRTWKEIPLDQLSKVSCAYVPDDHSLYVSVAEPQQTTNTAILRYSFRNKNWSGKEIVRTGTVEHGNPQRLIPIWQEGTGTKLFLIRDDVTEIDRYLIPGVDNDPYLNFGGLAAFRLETGFVELGRRLRVVRWRVDIGSDLGTVDVNSVATNAIVQASLNLRIEVRSTLNGDVVINAKDHGFDHIVPIGTLSAGWGTYHGETDPVLEGADVRLIITGTAQGEVALRIRNLEIDVQDRGPWRQDPVVPI